jgi:hypothetical protein
MTLAVGGGACVLLAAGLWWMLTAPTFAVTRVQSGPYRFSGQEEVDTALRVALGRNIWLLRARDVREACAHLPWLREIHVSRRVPDTVQVELVEWRPLLGVAEAGRADGHELVLIGDGRVLPMPDHLEAPALPLLVDARIIEDDHGVRRLESQLADRIDALLLALGETGFEASCPVDFVRTTPTGVTLELARQAGRVHLGREEFTERLTRYLLARERIPHGAEVDLRFADRITFQPATGDRS